MEVQMFRASVLALLFAGAARASSLSVACDCSGFTLYVDGQMRTQMAASAKIDAIDPGRHDVKIDVWTSPFKHEVWYSGLVDVPRGRDVRAKVTRGNLQIYSAEVAPPPLPPRDVQRAELRHDAVADAIDELRRAAELNEDERSRCQDRLADRLTTLQDRVRDLRRGWDDLERVLQKLDDARALADDLCPGRIADPVERRLRRAAEILRSSRPQRTVTPGMDGEAFRGLKLSLQGTPNELQRRDMVLATLQAQLLASAQLGELLDLFRNEVLKWEIAQAGVPRLVDPARGYALADKFHNGIYREQLTQLISQRAR
jgi:hypothetical protein